MADLIVVTNNTTYTQPVGLKAALESIGHTVTLINDSAIGATDFSSYDAVVVVRPSISSGVAAALRALIDVQNKPMLIGLYGQGMTAWYGRTGLTTHMKLTSTLEAVSGGANGINVTDNTHEITDEFSTGQLVCYTTSAFYWATLDQGTSYPGSALAYGDPDVGGISPNVDTVAIEAGTNDLDSPPVALGARVVLGGWVGGVDTAAGLNLLAAAIAWLIPELPKPDAPTLTAIGLGASIGVQTSAFSPAEQLPHISTTFEVTGTGDPTFAAPLFTFTFEDPSPYLINAILDGMADSTTYLVRAAHSSATGTSPWSNIETVTTLPGLPVPDAPTVTILDTGTDYVSAGGSVFTHPDGSTTAEDFDAEDPLPYLAFYEFQIRVTATSVVIVDTGPITAAPDATYGELLEEDLSDDTAYQIRARYWDGYNENTSAWGSWADFSTDAVPADQPAAPALTVATCAPESVTLSSAAFSHLTDPLATHAATRWRATLTGGYGGMSFITSDPAEMLAYTWEDLPAGGWTFDVAHQDDSGRWGDFGASDTCTQLERPEPPVFLYAGGVRLCADSTIQWTMETDPVTGFRFYGQLSGDDGETWATVFSNRATSSWPFHFAGRTDGTYILRVRAAHPGTTFYGDWSYLVIRVDRTCAAVVHYDFGEIEAMDPGWTVLWDDRATWELVTENGVAGAGFGIMAHADPEMTAVKSCLVFPELGQPTVYEAEVEFVLFADQDQWWWYRFTDNNFMQAGIAYQASGFDATNDRKGVFIGASQPFVFSFPHWGGDCPDGLCKNPCAFANGCVCVTALGGAMELRHNQPDTLWRYGAGYQKGRIRLEYLNKPPNVFARGFGDTSYIPFSGGKTRGMEVTRREGPTCPFRHYRYTLRQKVERTVTGGVRIRAKVFGPGLDPEAGWVTDQEVDLGRLQAIECGYVGLAMGDFWRSLSEHFGVVFTSFTISDREYDTCEPPPVPEPTPGAEPEYEPSKPCEVIVRCYDDDRETIRWEVGDNPLHPNPYLVALENYGEQELDIVNGAATVGQLEVIIIDRSQTIADQASGWLTERYRLVHGRRGRALRYIDPVRGWVVLADGPNSAPRLDESYAAMRYVIRDTRETERKVKAFVRAETSWILPMGVGPGFGAYVDEDDADQWLVPPAEPLVGDYSITGSGRGVVTFYDYWSGSFNPQGAPIGTQTVDEDVVLIPAVEEAALGTAEELGDPYPVLWTWPNLEILWRISGSSDAWTVVQPTDSTAAAGLVAKPSGAGRWWRSLITGIWDAELADGTEVRAASAMILRGLLAVGRFPEDGNTIEVAIRYVGPPTDAFPFHIEGLTTGQLLKKLYDGEYSKYDPITGEIVPTGIRYLEADLLQMTDPVLLRLTAPVDDARAWAEKMVYAPTGWVPALDNDGRISPKSQVPPDDFAGELLIDNAVTEPQPDWSAGETIVNVLSLTYPRYYRVGAADADSIDRLEKRDVTHEWRDESMVDRHNIQKAEYDGSAFAAVGDVSGQTVLTVWQELGYGHALNRKLYVFDRYKDGTPIIEVPVMREHCALLRAGDWVRVDLSWFPDHDTGRRGMLCGGQVLAIHDVDCAWRILLIERVVPLIEVS